MNRHSSNTSANRHNNKNSTIRELIKKAKNNENLLKTNQKLLEELISIIPVTIAKSSNNAQNASCMAEVVVDTTTARNFTHMTNDDPLYSFLAYCVTEEHSDVSSSDIRLKKVMMANSFMHNSRSSLTITMHKGNLNHLS